MASTLSQGATLVTMDRTLGELTGDVLIEDGRIEAVGAGIDAPAAEKAVSVQVPETAAPEPSVPVFGKPAIG